jgi:hypothetical protein
MGLLDDGAKEAVSRITIAERIRRITIRIAELVEQIRDTRRGLHLLPVGSVEHDRGEADVLLLEAERSGQADLLRGLQDTDRAGGEQP